MRYVDLYHSGELLERVRKAYQRLSRCNLCPHDCGVNRLRGETGFCRAGLKPKIASASVHWGEEPPISGTLGSGTIFFSHCSLRCLFCQNFPISQLGNGEGISTTGLAARMLKLQRQGVHNINLVTPGHFMPQILAALYLAIPQGFRLPLVWNSSGYDAVEIAPFTLADSAFAFACNSYNRSTVAAACEILDQVKIPRAGRVAVVFATSAIDRSTSSPGPPWRTTRLAARAATAA